MENAIGWYHSHPGYGCWLSGIDVGTQKLNQTYSEPFVAIVVRYHLYIVKISNTPQVDPKRTISAGKVELGAFRTYPEGHKPAGASGGDEFQAIPLEKIEDFGAHANSYYQLEVSYFKSTLDTGLLNVLWKRYWINTFSSSPLVAVRCYSHAKILFCLQNWGYFSNQMKDLANKIEGAQAKLSQIPVAPFVEFKSMEGGGGRHGGGGMMDQPGGSISGGGGGPSGQGIKFAVKKQKKNPSPSAAAAPLKAPVNQDGPLAKVVSESVNISCEASHALLSQVIKEYLFNREL